MKFFSLVQGLFFLCFCLLALKSHAQQDLHAEQKSQQKAIKELRKLGALMLNQYYPEDPLRRLWKELDSIKMDQKLIQKRYVERDYKKKLGLGDPHAEIVLPIRQVWLTGSQMDDSALVYLNEFPELKSVIIISTKISGIGLAHLKQTKIEFLAIVNSPVTDKELLYLQKQKNLTYLLLLGTKVTPKGIDKLKKSLPKLQVFQKLPSNIRSLGKKTKGK